MDQELIESKLVELQRKWGYVIAASFFGPQVLGSVLRLYVGRENYLVRIASGATAEEFLEQRRFMGNELSRSDVAGWYFYRVETD